MAGEDGSPKRRDVLRTGVAVGLLGFVGWSATGTAQDRQARNAFSHSLQEGDLFRVRFDLRNSAGDPVTETIPSDCLDGPSEEYQLLIVRAFRGSIELGYRDLFAPQQAVETENSETTPETETSPEETTPETATPEETTTEGTTTEAALQDATTTENETTPVDEETAPAEETTTAETGTTPADGQTLPELRRGEWYRVASSVRCANTNQLTLEAAEPPETTPGASETTTEE